MDEDIKKYLIPENIKSTYVLRRLKRESINFHEIFNSLSVIKDDKYYKIYLTDKKNYKYNNYCFILDDNYPFKSPKLLINDIPYKKFLVNGTLKFRELYTKMSGIECLCCHNILESLMWSPGYTINKIIEQVNLFRKYKKNIVNKMMADKIKSKYLIKDIDLETWLF